MQSLGHASHTQQYLQDLSEVVDLVKRGAIKTDGGRADYT